MSNSQDGFSRSPGFLSMLQTRLGRSSLGLTTMFLVLFVLWLFYVKAMPIPRPTFFFDPRHAFLLLGAVAAERYRIARRHAQGGLGTVFVAHDEELHREVALMSPEQAAGHMDRLGPASDIYSLGATLYNILTGVSPFTGSKVTKTLARVVEGDFPPLGRSNTRHRSLSRPSF